MLGPRSPQPLVHIVQLMVTEFLGTYISAKFSTTVHVVQTLSVANQRLFLLRQLKSQVLSHCAQVCSAIFRKSVVCRRQSMVL